MAKRSAQSPAFDGDAPPLVDDAAAEGGASVTSRSAGSGRHQTVESALPEPITDNKPTPAAEFRRVRVEGELITIPSTQRKVIMRTVQPEDILANPDAPELLQQLAIKVLYGSLTQKQYEEFWETAEQVEKALDYAKSQKAVITPALIYPRVSDDPKEEDEILYTDLTRAERRFLFDYALLEATALTTFREQQEGNVRALAASEGVAETTEQTAASQEVPQTVAVTDGPEVAEGVGEASGVPV